ncbi:hypothetical protein [Microbispora corallina]|uniref:hypothetical protein n=1 Tax=Microbispora corallina TaxID=83302 RepID=UPI00194DD46D|nr:hypothetical protein [Microbispora corallina]
MWTRIWLTSSDIAGVARACARKRYAEARSSLWPMARADPSGPVPVLLGALVDVREGRHAGARERISRGESLLRPVDLFRASQSSRSWVRRPARGCTACARHGRRRAGGGSRPGAPPFSPRGPPLAIAAARRAVALAPDRPEAHLVLGAALHTSAPLPAPTRRAETVAVLERALDLAPANRRTQDLLARARMPRRRRLLRRLRWTLLGVGVVAALGAIGAAPRPAHRPGGARSSPG